MGCTMRTEELQYKQLTHLVMTHESRNDRDLGMVQMVAFVAQKTLLCRGKVRVIRSIARIMIQYSERTFS